MKEIKTAVIGASGYTGVELLRILLNHPNVKIRTLVAESNAGQPIGNIYPHLSSLDLPDLITLEEVDWNDIELAFFCLPHGVSQSVIPKVPQHIRIIDLAADFRIYDPDAYQYWYGKPHVALKQQKEAVYGLTEIFRSAIRGARLVSCPGCYPTSVLLPLMPLVESGKISLDGIIIDAKSGITGAGRAAKTANLFSEANEGVKAYSISKHRHMGEIEQSLSAAAGTKVMVTFTPQVVPMSRGILSTIYVKMIPEVTVDDLRDVYEDVYRGEPFIRICKDDHAPSTREVYGTNICAINIFENRIRGRAIIVSVIDNLMKGASGQAVQNMNVMYGFKENTGLKSNAMFP